jgi:radical SAM superfamily enzyme YgiQ (UPF0313 family)
VNILLISPNTLREPYPVYPLGLDHVAAAIDPRHRVEIADCNTLDRDGLARLLLEFSPRIIGISCRNIDNTDAARPRFFIHACRDLIRWLRERSRAVLVIGGAGFTIMPERIFPELDADFGVIGEGERFGQLVEALDRGERPERIDGIIGRGGSARLPAPWPHPLARRLPAGQTGHHRYYVERGGMLNLQSKRGCAFSCLYCPYPHIEGHRHRLIDPDQVARAAVALERAGARYLFFTDSAFNSDINHSLAVAESLKAAGLTIPWGGFFAPIRLPGDYFQVMADCGLTHVEFGTESLAPAMLRAYKKPFHVDDVVRAHDHARAAGIHTAHYLLLGGPGESATTVAETLASVDRLARAVFFFFIGVRVYPHTGLYDQALARGQIRPETDLLEPVFYRPRRISLAAIRALVEEAARGRPNWVTGSGGQESAGLVRRLHDRGFTGPLWEYLAR